MGGSSLPSTSNDDLEEEEEWVDTGFMSGVEGRLGVKKLGGFLRNLQEEREAEGVRDARRFERRLDEQGEEFDEESDEEDEDTRVAQMRVLQSDNQGEVEIAFEKKLLELFVDGLDTITYDEVDFREPPGGDPIAVQDDLDRYFDEEEPNATSTSTSQQGSRRQLDELSTQNGKGEYDY